MKIYYAHSISSYDTAQEEFDIAQIKNSFNGDVVNPKTIQSKNMSDYYREIKKCDAIVFRGNTFGIISEVIFSMLTGKKIIDAELMQGISRRTIFEFLNRFYKDRYYLDDIKQISDVILEQK